MAKIALKGEKADTRIKRTDSVHAWFMCLLSSQIEKKLCQIKSIFWSSLSSISTYGIVNLFCCITDMTSKSKKQGKKRRAEDVAESESDSSADEQDLAAFHRRMNEDDADQEAGGRWVQKYKNTLLSTKTIDLVGKSRVSHKVTVFQWNHKTDCDVDGGTII